MVKFSEFLSFSTVGHEGELINMLRNLNEKKSPCKSRGHLGPSKCDHELRKLECAINYNEQGVEKCLAKTRETHF